MSDAAKLLQDLARAKAAFQLRTLVAIVTATPATKGYERRDQSSD